MNAIEKALQDVLFSIPRELLHHTFIKRGTSVIKYPVSIETIIREKVINARVMVDCNLVGGVQVEIPLLGLNAVYAEGNNLVYKIPKTLTEGRSISSVLSAGYGIRQNVSHPSGTSSLIRQALAVADGADDIPITSEANVRLIGENTVLVVGDSILSSDLSLRCIVTNDGDMANLKPTAIPAFSKLVVLAVKAYIYVNSVVPMDKGQLYGGMTIGSFKETVDSYADANELYTDYLRDEWKAISFMDDLGSYHRMLSLSMG